MTSFAKTKHYTSFNILLILLLSVMIGLADPSGYIAYAYTVCIFLFFNYFCKKEYRGDNFALFNIYLIFALMMFFIHRYQLPNYMGLTGPEGGVGTDDVRYYAGLPNVQITYSTERMDIAENNPYTILLSWIYPFHIYNPVQIVILNIIGICFLPYLTHRTAEIIMDDKKVATIAQNLMTFCPFILSIGLIIMRDIICTSIILAAFVCFANKKYLIFLAFTGLLAFLKFGFVVFLVIILACYYVGHGLENTHNKRGSKSMYILMLTVFFALFVVLIMPRLGELTGGRITSDSLFRDSFLEYLEGANEGSILVKLYSLPIFLRIPALIVTFLIIPPLTLNIFYDGIFIPKNLLQNVFAPIFWWFLYYYFFMFCISIKKHTSKGKTLFWIIILLALALGMISLQTRHKAVLIPFMYIAMGYSMAYPYKKYSALLVLLTIVFIMAQLVYCVTHL